MKGHCHPKILEAMISQSHRCTLSSRAFYNDVFPQFAKYITEKTGFDMVLPMNTGAEAVETAIKLARKWGYEKKGISKNNAKLVHCAGCFHGRTLAIVSMSDDPDAYEGYGPYLEGLVSIPYNDVNALEEILKKEGENIAGFLVEPIQGEAGVVVPDDGYLRRCQELCKQYNVLFIADEIQTGLCRTGKFLACDHDGVKPDVLILGKALSGGVLPVSAVLAQKEVMEVFKPGQHGSTYGGNPLSSAVALASLQVLFEENLSENSDKLGKVLRDALNELKEKYPFITNVRGKGLLNAIVIDESYSKSAYDLCIIMKNKGLLAKPTHNTIIRLAPPLIITPEQMDQCIRIIQESVEEFSQQ